MHSEEAMAVVQLALANAHRGGVIVGIDYSGNPHVGSFATHRPALEFARANNLRVTLHIAEIVNDAETLVCHCRVCVAIV